MTQFHTLSPQVLQLFGDPQRRAERLPGPVILPHRPKYLAQLRMQRAAQRSEALGRRKLGNHAKRLLQPCHRLLVVPAHVKASGQPPQNHRPRVARFSPELSQGGEKTRRVLLQLPIVACLSLQLGAAPIIRRSSLRGKNARQDAVRVPKVRAGRVQSFVDAKRDFRQLPCLVETIRLTPQQVGKAGQTSSQLHAISALLGGFDAPAIPCLGDRGLAR